ncbi:F-box protein SKIP19-like [Silene latifolia]|uniref:F-box protein SKIP19-like n=1 Tax=Silene latifolia TaxID=37657 RepID=UPI003D774DD8
MYSISNPTENPNPKPPLSINQPSSSNSIEIKRNKKNKKKRIKTKLKRKKKKKTPNWVELPEDIWFLILSKLTTIDIIENVQKVCMLFRKICKQATMFKAIDMSLPRGYAFMELPYDLNAMTRFAVDRSGGGLVDIYMEYLCDDDTLVYIVERSKNLKHLRLAHYVYVSDEELIEAAKKLPMLEEVQIIICSFSEETVEAVGHACPTLTSFSITGIGSKKQNHIFNEEALAISRSMPNLRHLQLIGNNMSNEGLKAILDGCPLLESLDLRACFQIDLSGDLGKRCERIQHLRYPNDTTADYGRDTCSDDNYFPTPQQLSEYDSDDSDMFGTYPEYLGFGAHEDLYPDFLDDIDDYSLLGEYFGGFPGF